MTSRLIYVKQGDTLTVSWPATIVDKGPAPGGYSSLEVTADYIEIEEHDPIREAVEAEAVLLMDHDATLGSDLTVYQ